MSNITLKNIKSKKGQLTLQLLIYGSIAIIFLAGFLIWIDAITKAINRSRDRLSAFSIAEAGIEYYRWHLAHAPQDYQDGTSSPGPYTHNYYDKTGNLIGQFILDITPPPIGSTIVTIKSTGETVNDPTVEKAIKVKMGIQSFAKYAAAINDNIRFGQGTEVFGSVQSNGGIRFDGIAHNLISSALSSYDDPDHSGNNEFGVHTHVNSPPGSGVNDNFRPLEAPPNPVPTRSDVFLAGRNFPVPALDFTGITQNISKIKDDAKANGFYAASSTNHLGYEIVLKTNNTFDFYSITALVPPPSGCTNSQNQDGWGTWSIQSENFLSNNPIPQNGLIFIEDNVWVRGQINKSRATITSAMFPDTPSTRTSITVNKDILYTNYDGQNVISLIAQKNINIGMVSSDIIRIDAALMAQNGRVGRYYYGPPSLYNNGCSPYHVRTAITTYGMIASNQRYGFAYTDNTGYQTRKIVYDSNLLYGPPPSFPLTTNNYQTIYWDETD